MLLPACGDDPPAPTPDLSSAALDLSMTPPDLAAPDLSVPLDLAMPDLSVQLDLAMPDFATPPDLFTCTANAFRSCAGTVAHYCNGAGDGETLVECGSSGCHGPSSCGQCTPDTVTCSSSMVLASCNARGRVTVTNCALGCIATGADADAGTPASAHCANIVPSNAFSLDCVVKTGTLDVHVTTGTMIFDPDTGMIDGAAAGAGVYDGTKKSFHLKSLAIDAGTTLAGKAGAVAPLVLLVDGNVLIDGTLDVAAHLNAGKTLASAGPGAVAFGVGGNASSLTTGTVATQGTGGAGGSFGSSGANGARLSGTTFGIARPPYPLTTDPTSLVPIQGGSGGGKAGGNLAPNPSGGGGAVQLVSCGTVTVSATGLVNAGGSGAPKASTTTFSGGGGGGSGGGVLLEAPTLTVSGIVAAAGGTGGGGAVTGTANLHGEAGFDAPVTLTCSATGGAGAMAAGGSQGGTGGIGACAATSPTSGTTGTVGTTTADPAGHGGGGGGGGRIRFNSNALTVTEATSVSPNTTACYKAASLPLQ
ncbi:MAG TPA: hypothetical protein VMZ28_04460 [Kofleriaceae bacterium]|nr:hypothetical protein [Kofleriaceae bacterium]